MWSVLLKSAGLSSQEELWHLHAMQNDSKLLESIISQRMHAKLSMHGLY